MSFPKKLTNLPELFNCDEKRSCVKIAHIKRKNEIYKQFRTTHDHMCKISGKNVRNIRKFNGDFGRSKKGRGVNFGRWGRAGECEH